ncbi:hypothetical protein [Bradyrhizobium sp. 142]|uniref:hypothetical protein n=1 Tax=Bradyrhizobium sp. 142 TaxID=2782618 RepID=UPI001FF8A9F1|nr:hypothetical protein [Bradyrhizobium sp. 142]MCK1730975.1 hypothetical protein [Bradyrhizobium sp. 142]
MLDLLRAPRQRTPKDSKFTFPTLEGCADTCVRERWLTWIKRRAPQSTAVIAQTLREREHVKGS